VLQEKEEEKVWQVKAGKETPSEENGEKNRMKDGL
jgi:hypothetical protein